MKGDPDPRRLLLAGDVHGNEWWIAVLAGVAARLDCDAILQVGDFGYDPRDKAGRRFLRRADAAMDLFGLRLFWIDGNHDNHDALAAEARDDNGMTVIGSLLRHLPRGYRWEWSGVRFGALGGAFSSDWEERKKRGDWWPAEALTDEDVEALGHERLDVLVTHDAPIGVPLNSGLRLDPVGEMRGEENRHRVGQAVERTLSPPARPRPLALSLQLRDELDGPRRHRGIGLGAVGVHPGRGPGRRHRRRRQGLGRA